MVTKKPTPKTPKMPMEGAKHEKMEKDGKKKGGKC